LNPILGFSSNKETKKNNIYKLVLTIFKFLSLNFGRKCFLKSTPEELGAQLLHGGHVADGQALLDTDDQGLHVEGVVKVVGVDDRVVEGVRRLQKDPSAAFGVVEN
jgi:hypothetical protein